VIQTKGQQPLDKPELLALCVLCGGVAERLNASGLHPADDAQNIVRGSESLPHRQISNNTPAEALTSTGAKTAQPKAIQVPQPQYPAFGCETQQEISHELPGLQSEV
jgi:hypothetical protein